MLTPAGKIGFAEIRLHCRVLGVTTSADESCDFLCPERERPTRSRRPQKMRRWAVTQILHRMGKLQRDASAGRPSSPLKREAACET